MTIDLSKYLIQDDPETSKDIHIYSDQQIDLNKYISPESETGLQSFKRHATRTGSRISETVLGFPGDVVQFGKFLSEKLPKGPEFLQKEPNFIQRAGKKGLESIPSSQDLKEMTSYLSSGFTDPKSAEEELGDDITSLATSLLIPSKDPIKFKSLLSSLGMATVAKGARKGAEQLGAGEVGKAATELGTLFLTGLIGKKTADKFVSDQFKQARSKIPQGTMIETKQLVNDLDKVGEDLFKGISTSTKREVGSAVNELKLKAAGGAMPVDELVQSYHDLNERINSKKLFDELSTSERKILKHRYDQFKDKLSQSIENYGRNNPEFFDQWKKANQSYATIAQSKKVSNFLQKNIGNLPKHLAGTLLLETLMGYPKVAAGTLAGAGAVKTGELLYRIAKSPKLREHYLNILRESGNENLPAVIKNINEIDKGLKNN